MTVKEMIMKYDIVPESNDFGNTFTGRLAVRNPKLMKADNAESLIRENKPEILAYFEKEKAEREAKAREKEKRIEAIEGLKEIRSAMAEMEDWKRKFNGSFDGEYAVGGLGVGEYPAHDIKGMLERYPHAAAYLKAEEYSLKTNYELARIGEKALQEVIYGDFQKAMNDMDADLKAFFEKHLWD
jgi:hypothetical protein